MDSSIASSGCWRLLIATLLLSGTVLPLRAQTVVDGLPPPPNLPAIQPALPPEFTTPASTVPASTPVDRETLPEPYRPAEGIPLRPEVEQPSSAYLVYVDGDSPLLLAQVQRVESSAFVDNRNGEQVIQAGVFGEENRAQQQLLALRQQGIEAQVQQITRSTTPPSADRPDAVAMNSLPPDLLPEVAVPQQVEFGQPLNTPIAPANNQVAVRSSSYYVVVPGRRSNLPDIANLVTLLGGGLNVTEDEVQELGSPRGSHVLVGPFVDRRTASRWNRYFRDFGLDARVYYRR